MLSGSVVHETHETIELVAGDHRKGDQLRYRFQPIDVVPRSSETCALKFTSRALGLTEVTTCVSQVASSISHVASKICETSIDISSISLSTDMPVITTLGALISAQ